MINDGKSPGGGSQRASTLLHFVDAAPYADRRIDIGSLAHIIHRMEKLEWWQSPVIPAAFVGTIVLVLGYAACGRSNATPPAEAAPARAVAAPAAPSPPDEAPLATTVTMAAPAAPVSKAEATAMLAELHALEKVGREMAGNRCSGDLASATPGDMAGQRRCMDAMRDARPRLEKIRARTADLPEGLFSIGLSASELAVCLVCTPSGEACAQAKQALDDADLELARVRW